MDDRFHFQNVLLMSKQQKRKRAIFYDRLLEEDYDDYEENEEVQEEVWNNIAKLAEVLENEPPRKVRTPDKDAAAG